MPTLSSLLVQRGIAPIRAVEDAIARQVFQGGDLATNLLELGSVREAALLPILAETHGLEPGPVGALLPPSNDVLRLVPGDLAARHGIFPIELQARVLVIAVSEPLPPAVEDDLGFALDIALRQVISTQVRIRQAIAGCYGIPLDRRMLRLQAKLDGRNDPSPSAAPPPERDLLPARMPQPVSIPVPTFASGVPGSERAPARLKTRPAPKAPFVDEPQDLVNPAIPRSPALPSSAAGPPASPRLPPPPSDRANGGTSDRSDVGEGPLVGRGPSAHVHTKPWSPEDGPDGPAPIPAPPQNPALVQLVDTLPGPPPEGRQVIEAPRSAVATRALAGVLRDALKAEQAVDKRKGPTWRAAERRRKGPFTTGRAEQELEESTSTDEVLDTLFAFAHQFFEYSALFVVHGDLAEGREASGPGADRAAVAGIGVPLDLPSHLADARTHRAPVIARPSSSGLDADLVRDLGRGPRSTPRAAAFLPVSVRTRTVAILYGDDGDTDVELGAIGEVISLIGLAGAALERIALRKKLGAKAPEMSLKVRVQEGAAALARTLAASAAQVTHVTKIARTTPAAAAPPAQPPAARAPIEAVRADAKTEPSLSSASEPSFVPRPSPAAIEDADTVDATEVRAPPPLEPPETIVTDDDPDRDAMDDPPPRATAHTRRGLAPSYEGRGHVAPDAAQASWVRAGDAHATAWSGAPPDEPRRGRTPPFRPSSVPPRPSLNEGPADVREKIQHVIEGGNRGREAFEELVRDGEHVIQTVMARFPGPLRVDRHRARGELPPASQCGPVLELAIAIKRPALPFISSRTSAQDLEVRFWATHCLGELRYPEAGSVLVPRLFDDDAQVRRIGRRSAAALVNAGAAGAPILKGLEDIVRNPDEPKVHRLVAIETMGEIRSGLLVPPLLDALDDHSEDIADASRRALLLITRQDFGKDIERWRDWWAANAGRHRIEWLIDALMHEQPSVRRAAGDELKLSTKEYFGYYDDLPKRDRERAQGLYRAWWDREGQRRFATG